MTLKIWREAKHVLLCKNKYLLSFTPPRLRYQMMWLYICFLLPSCLPHWKLNSIWYRRQQNLLNADKIVVYGVSINNARIDYYWYWEILDWHEHRIQNERPILPTFKKSFLFFFKSRAKKVNSSPKINNDMLKSISLRKFLIHLKLNWLELELTNEVTVVIQMTHDSWIDQSFNSSSDTWEIGAMRSFLMIFLFQLMDCCIVSK